MSRYRSIKNSFLGGMVSPTAVGRTDLPQYAHSCEILQNVIPMLSGGVYRRPGTLSHDYLQYTPNGTDHAPRIIPFVVSASETYCVLIGRAASNYIKTYRPSNANGSVTPATATGTHPWLPVVAPGTNSEGGLDDDWWLVQYAQSADVMWLVHPFYKPQILKRSATDTFTIGDFDAGLSGQSLVNAYPFLNQNATGATMAPSATSGSGINLTCSTSFFKSGHVGAIFCIDHGSNVGAIKITSITSATVAVGTVLVNFGATTAKPQWWESAWSDYQGWPRTVAIYKQRLVMGGNANQPDTMWFSHAGGYFTFSELGLSAPATTILPNGNTIAASGSYVRYPVDNSQGDGASTGPVGTQAFRITLAQSQLDKIQWLSPDQELLVGTQEQEWVVSPINQSFDVGNSAATIQSHYGSDFVPSVRIGYELMFVPRSGDEVRAYQYNYIDASFFGEPVQMFFDQYPQAEQNTLRLGRRKFRQMDWDVTRNTLWCTDTMGNLFGMTRDRKLQVTMWHTHQFGGYDSTKGVAVTQGSFSDPSWSMCDGSVISMAVVPNPYIGTSDIWVVIKRTLSSNTQVTYQVERMIGKNTPRTSAFQAVAPIANGEPLYVDGASIFTDNADGTKTYSVGDNLDGYSLSGTYCSLTWGLFPLTTSAVSAGIATLTGNLPADYGSATPFHAFSLGLPYTSIIKTVRQDAGSVIGTAQGAIKKIARVYVRFFKTLYAKIGSPPGTTSTAPYAITWTPNPAQMGQSPEIFTGDKKVEPFISPMDRDQYIYLIQDQPMPFTVISIIAEGQEFDQ